MRSIRISTRLILVGLALGTASCGRSEVRKPTFAVVGKVVAGSKPIANATVVFHPVADSSAVKARGKTDAGGSFTLTSYEPDDGAAAGEYQVTIELWLVGRPDEGPSNRLPSRLAKPELTPLHATVLAGPTELKAFDVKK